jgi:hypothetical protein
MRDLRPEPVQPVRDVSVGSGRNVVVVIGIDRHDAWSNLDNAVSDARGTVEAFPRLGLVEHPGLFGETATRDALHALVTDLRTLGVNDSLGRAASGSGSCRTPTTRERSAARLRATHRVPRRRICAWHHR